jgi:hypothetical protein
VQDFEDSRAESGVGRFEHVRQPRLVDDFDAVLFGQLLDSPAKGKTRIVALFAGP